MEKKILLFVTMFVALFFCTSTSAQQRRFQPVQPKANEVNVTAVLYSATDYDGDMYISLETSGMVFYFDVLYTGAFEMGKTYKYDDMWKQYTTMKTTSSNPVAATDAEITVTEVEGLINVEAMMVVSGVTYNITYKQRQAITADVTAVNYDAEYYNGSNDWYVVMEDAEGAHYIFDIFAPSSGFESGKTYTFDDLDPYFTGYAPAGSYLQDCEAVEGSTFTYTEGEGGFVVNAVLVTTNNDRFNITYSTLPTGVKDIVRDNNSDAPAYNLMGVKVGEDYKGIVIKNGKKVIMK